MVESLSELESHAWEAGLVLAALKGRVHPAALAQVGLATRRVLQKSHRSHCYSSVHLVLLLEGDWPTRPAMVYQ